MNRELTSQHDNLDHERHYANVANVIIHTIGALISLCVLYLMCTQIAPNTSSITQFGGIIFAGSLSLFYIISTLYHAISHKTLKSWLARLDHGSLYLLIAGTYTPLILVPFNINLNSWLLLGLVWGIGIVNLLYRVITHRNHEWLTTAGYIAIGWLGVLIIGRLVGYVSLHCLMWMITGGTAYVLGGIFFSCDSEPFAHTWWHMCILMGSLCHYFAILRCIIPLQ